jgi:sulfatase-like protein
MRKRLVLIAVVAVAAVAAVVAAASDDPDGRRTASASVASKPHVMLLILDEFPSDALLDRSGRIDPVRYPNFAALAAGGTWFRNAYSYYDSTTKAVPLILDGVRPYKSQPSDRRGHPHSIYDVLGRRGYRMVDSEEATAICPRRWCPNAPRRRPAIIPHLNSGRRERLDAFIRSVEPSGRPTFWMKHMLLPHGPYMFLPSGAQTRSGARDLVPAMNSTRGFHDEFLTRHNEQRFLLQVGFVDRQLGRIVKRLKEQGMYDDTLIAVVADHGFAWQVGVDNRRRVRDSNVEEMAPVPLIVKAPRQTRGRVSRAYASTLDVTPTIADVLGYRLGYRADGRSAFSRAVRRRRVVAMPDRGFTKIVRISGRRWEALRRRVVRRRLRQFGSGEQGLFTGIGPNRELIGRSTAELQIADGGAARASIADAGELRNVRRASGIVPAQIAGDLTGGRRGAKRDVAVAVNGRIEAVGRTFYLKDDSTEHFAVNVPESALREGRNAVEVLEVGPRGGLRLLARL